MTARLLAALSLASLIATHSSFAQVTAQPFTLDEIHKVTLLFVGEPDATRFAQSLFHDEKQTVPETVKQRQANPDGRLAHSGIHGVTFTPDMLALLSFLSDTTKEKVESYMQRTLGRPMTVAERAEWENLRTELLSIDEVKQWLTTTRQSHK